MKKLLLLCLIAALSASSNAQRIRLTDTTNTWRVYCDGGGTDYYSVVYDYAFRGDTAMFGYTYKRLLGATRVLFLMQSTTAYAPKAGTFYFREDSLTGKAWCRRKVDGGQTDTAEYLIYNAAWAVNDTIEGSPHGSKSYIKAIDSTQVGGQWYRVFKLKNTSIQTGSANYFDIVEGIGATIGPGYAFTGGSGGEYRINLQCFYNNGSKPVLNPVLDNLFQNNNAWKFSNAGPCNLAVADPGHSGKSFLSPNPVTGASKIVLPQVMQQGRLAIYNSSGQMVSSTAISNTAAIPLPTVLFVPGIYFYRITDQKDGTSFTGRFVYE